MYLAVPMTLYACERLIRFFRSSIKPVKILKVFNTNPKPNGHSLICRFLLIIIWCK